MVTRVEKGAELLDKVRPGWAKEVNGAMLAGLFDMGDPQHCVLGTLELVDNPGSFMFTNPLVVFNGTRITNWLEARKYGFDTDTEADESYSELEELWQEQINDRL